MDDLPSYVAGGCPNCGRHRLMPLFGDEEVLLGIECEKCHMAWPMNREGEYASEYDAWPHPITGWSADREDEARGLFLTQPQPKQHPQANQIA